jgi:glutathione S-transferase
MNLYVFPVAPNPTKVRLYLAEKESGGGSIAINEVMVDLREGAQKSPEHLSRNPFGKLPVLEFDDGTFLIESLAIIEYLEELHPDPPMLGSNALERACVRELERIVELGVLLPVSRIVHTTNSPLGLPPEPEVAAYFRGVLPGALDFLDRRLSDGRPFVAGEHPSIADCTLQSAFQFARFGQVSIDPTFANLARWDRDYRERPSAQKVLSL